MQVSPLSGKALVAVQNMDADIVAWEGAVRASKTFTSLIAWMDYVRNGPAGPLAMVGKTARTVRQNLIDTMAALVGSKRCRFIEGSGLLHLFGRRIYVVGANDERSLTKIQGLTLAGAYVDECATIPESFFNMLRSRLSIDGARLFLTSNPASPAHWLKTKWLDRARLWIDRDGVHHVNSDPSALDLVRVTFTMDDNPTLSERFKDSLKASYTGLFYRRYVLAEWVSADGACFDMWDPDRHVVDTVPPIIRWLGVGVDYGTSNPFSAVLGGIGMDRVIYLVSEWRYDGRAQRRQLTDAEYSQRVRGWIADPTPDLPEDERLRDVTVPYWVVDPSAASFIAQAHRDGLSTWPADNAVVDSIRLASSLLAAGKLRVHSRCKDLISEVPGYSWDPKAQLLGRDEPIKVADHSIDAGLRYLPKTTEGTWRQYVDLDSAA